MQSLSKTLVFISFLMLIGDARAEESSPGMVDKVANAVKQGASAAARGIDHGVQAAVRGIERGASATAQGVERGATATGNAAHRVADKIDGTEPAKHPASVPVTDR